jgi:hypothetical protein
VTRTANLDLRPLPSDEEVVAAVRALCAGGAHPRGVTAAWVAIRLGVEGARRHGRGAVKGSWSGTMSGAVRIAPRLRSLERRGLLVAVWDREDFRWVYSPADE